MVLPTPARFIILPNAKCAGLIIFKSHPGSDVVNNYLIAGVIAVVIIAAYLMLTNAPGQNDAFAQCVGASGAKMYGAYWCPHCNDQKHMFGNSWRFIEYVECSLPDDKGQTDACITAGIRSYPTWEFKDGTRSVGALSFEELAQKTNCSAALK
jgi:hypothetical protein